MADPYIAAEKFAKGFRDAEYALKRSATFLGDRHGVAETNWNALAAALDQPFFDHVVASGMAKTLIGDPPRQLKSDGLEWMPKQTTPLTNVQQLIVQGVCRVRNSYIHGEKFRGGPEGQWERDATLIEEAHAVLDEAMKWLLRGQA